ncbi:MAG: hypothetical protein ACE5GS_14195 [Kiloniellaceae bacterium]
MTVLQWPKFREVVRLGAFAGLAGGLAEILWIWFYAALTGADAAPVVRGVSVAVGAGTAAAPVALGIGIHMVLAVALGIALASALRPLFARLPGNLGRYGVVLAALALVWAINFFVVLPQISPSFVHLVPYQISLLSKLLFGFTAATVLRSRPAAQPAAPRA